MQRSLKFYLPEWAQDWLEVIVPGLHILLIVVAAWLLHRLLCRALARASAHYDIPLELQVPMRGLLGWTIFAGAVLLVLERLGVSATVLWTAFTGFATVGAVAFFAAWSVLSNLFCALLIFTVRPFRIGNYIEVLDTADKPGAKGRVVDINLLYTTLEDHGAAVGHTAWLQIPNALIFQRVVRRFQHYPPPAEAAPPTEPTAPVQAVAAPLQPSALPVSTAPGP